MFDVQDYAGDASSYKKLTYTKNLSRKRGRSFNRREKRATCTESRIMRDKLAASFAGKEFRREMKQFEKTTSEAATRGIHDIPMPDFLVSLRDTMRLHEGNLTSAHIAHEVMNKFPPLH